MCTKFQSLDSPSFELRYFGLDSFFGFLHIELCLKFAYLYNLGITSVMPVASGCLTRKKTSRCLAVLV
jgi:hypothetical protein